MAEGSGARLALYRKYRPTRLGDVIGQPQVTDILQVMADKRAFAQSYLFTGQRGTGKTTVARILAHLINDTPYDDAVDSGDVDIIEIDAASNNGVDDVREIRDGVNLAPMNSSHKVYIIDEFHMLSKAAFNALLKTIEEPPSYVVFILATTELQKVPATILSRVQRFQFRPVDCAILTKYLRMIAGKESIKANDEALRLIARAGGGSVRDSITLLDQLSGGGEITSRMVMDVLGLVPDEKLRVLIEALDAGDARRAVALTRETIGDGIAPSALASELIDRLEEDALSNPKLYELIDKLLVVPGSTLPEAKLIATLALWCLRQGDETSLTALGLSASPAQASTPGEKQLAATPPLTTPAAKSTNAEAASKRTIKPPKSITPPTGGASVKAANVSVKINFKWNDFLEQIASDDQPSIRSVLDQGDYRYDASAAQLTLYFSKKFFRAQAKGQAFTNAMIKAANELYGAAPTIIVSDDPAPSDSAVAAVLAAVGGEVTKVDDGEG